MRNVSHKSCRGNQITFFFFKLVLFEIIWKNTVVQDRPQISIWHMRIACCIPKATNTHLQYVILIVFPLQQWLQDHDSVLRYMYVVYVGMGLNLHQIFYRQILRVKDRTALHWVVHCHKSDYYLIKSTPIQYNKVV